MGGPSLIANITDYIPSTSKVGVENSSRLDSTRTNPDSNGNSRLQSQALSQPQLEDGALATQFRPISKFIRSGIRAGIETGGKLSVDSGKLLKDYWQKIFSKDPSKQGITNSRWLALSGLGLTAGLMTLKTIFESAQNIVGNPEQQKGLAPLIFQIAQLVIGAGLAVTAHNTVTRNGKPGSENLATLAKWFIAFIGVDQISHLYRNKPNMLRKITDFCGVTEPIKEFMDTVSLRSLTGANEYDAPPLNMASSHN